MSEDFENNISKTKETKSILAYKSTQDYHIETRCPPLELPELIGAVLYQLSVEWNINDDEMIQLAKNALRIIRLSTLNVEFDVACPEPDSGRYTQMEWEHDREIQGADPDFDETNEV